MKKINKKLLNLHSAENQNILDLDENTKNELNIKMVIALFETIYRQNIITKKQYDKILAKIYRTYNLSR